MSYALCFLASLILISFGVVLGMWLHSIFSDQAHVDECRQCRLNEMKRERFEVVA